MPTREPVDRRGDGRARTEGPQFRRGLAVLAASDAEQERVQSRSYKKRGGPKRAALQRFQRVVFFHAELQFAGTDAPDRGCIVRLKADTTDAIRDVMRSKSPSVSARCVRGRCRRDSRSE